MIFNSTLLFSITSALILLLQLLVFNCGAIRNAEEAQTMVRVGQEFAVGVGQDRKLEGADLQVKFVEVRQDSRCPTGVNCVWAGNAEVALEVIQNKCPTRLVLNTNSSPQTPEDGKVSGFRVKLVKLNPYPKADQKISPSEYKATLIVTKD